MPVSKPLATLRVMPSELKTRTEHKRPLDLTPKSWGDTVVDALLQVETVVNALLQVETVVDALL
jgi:hypothetical protein